MYRKRLASILIMAGLLLITCSHPFIAIEQSFRDSAPPEIIINFAGNPSDSGGPYWRPPGESTQLDGVFSDGYYTNDSRQQETWIYINLTVEDESNVAEVWLHWLNETTWTNDTYMFTHTDQFYWEFNSSGNITTEEGYNYSFDIYAVDASGNGNITTWSKEGLTGLTRRYVQLSCTSATINYVPFYYYNISYGGENTNTFDRMHHDQGPNGSIYDTAYLRENLPTDFISFTTCSAWVGGWFDESRCIETTAINNIYYHFWLTSIGGGIRRISWERKRTSPSSASAQNNDVFSVSKSDNRSTIFYDNGHIMVNDNYYLYTHLQPVSSPPLFTDNSIYEFLVKFDAEKLDPNVPKKGSSMPYPSAISNRSFTSFILFNVPDNETLNSSYYDTDSDMLSDWTELYKTFTNPFLADTDNDGYADYDECSKGSDPNDYNDTPLDCGDVNDDNSASINDVFYLIDYIFNYGPAPNPLCIGDVNNDNNVNIMDAVYLINYIYKGGAAPLLDCCR